MGLLEAIEQAYFSGEITDEDLADLVASLPPEQRMAVREEAYQAAGVAGAWAFDPVGYVTQGLRETLWSVQRQILESLRDNVRTAVPATVGAGKTFLAARVVAWWLDSWPVGTAMAVTTATSYRLVKGQLWAHIRRLHRSHGLLGRVNLTEWWVGQEQIGIGFSTSDQDPEGVQGWRAPHVLVVVDEAGGISEPIGMALEGLLATGHARMLAIGNPSTDATDTWFQRVCQSERWNVIPLPAHVTPNFTGERTGRCFTCPPGSPRHDVAFHLVKPSEVEGWVEDYGEESAWVQAKVYARFPQVVANAVIPASWVEEAVHADATPGVVVSLGVDVAAGGGDELAVARREGHAVSLVHNSSGPHLANSVDVAGLVLEQILAAEDRARELGHADPVRVKVDTIGVGWGVMSTLQRWGEELRHHSEVVGVNVAEKPGNPEKFARQRDEMWWNMRELLTPGQGERPTWRLDVDQRTRAQLSSPTYGHTSSGLIVVESKDSMRKRGLRSPDRAEAALLAVYEPPGKPKRQKLEILV